MRTRAPATLLTAAASLSLLGCGPSVATLVRTHHTAEAFCRASNAEEAALVTPPMLEQVAPEWRVRRILAADLPQLDAAWAHELFERYVFVAVEVQTHSAAAIHLDFFVSFSPTEPSKRDIGLAFMLISPSDFVAITGETKPESKEVTETKLAHPEKAIPWAIVTLGASLFFADRVTQTSTQYPTDAERRAAAPKSAALYDAIRGKFGSVPVVAMAVGEDARRFRARTDLLIDNHNGALAAKCRAELRVTLEGEPFALTASEPWPAGKDFRRFEAHAWTNAVFSQGRESFALPRH